MFKRFTDRVRKVMHFANQEAARRRHEYVGTEHILFGLLHDRDNLACSILKHIGVSPDEVAIAAEKQVHAGPDLILMGKLPQTPRAKRLIELTIEEATNAGHQYVGTEHLLLGMLREQEGIAAIVLWNLGVTVDKVREAISGKQTERGR